MNDEQKGTLFGKACYFAITLPQKHIHGENTTEPGKM